VMGCPTSGALLSPISAGRLAPFSQEAKARPRTIACPGEIFRHLFANLGPHRCRNCRSAKRQRNFTRGPREVSVIFGE
jgi:hypothetical protein